jgi:hypothetical protein
VEIMRNGSVNSKNVVITPAKKNDKTTTVMDTTTPKNMKVLILFFVSKVVYLYGCNTPIYLSNVMAHDVNMDTAEGKTHNFKAPRLKAQF